MVTRQSFNRRTAEPQSAFITVREAAQQRGIGEGLAYRMANQYLASRWARDSHVFASAVGFW